MGILFFVYGFLGIERIVNMGFLFLMPSFFDHPDPDRRP